MIVLYHKLLVFCKSDPHVLMWYNLSIVHKHRSPIQTTWRDTSYEYDCCDGSPEPTKPLTASTDQEIYLALLDIVREQSAAPRPSRHGPQALLYQCRVPDRQAAVQQPYQFRAVRRHPRRAGRCRAKTCPILRRSSRSRALAMAGWAVWPPASLTPSPPLNLPGDGVGLRYHFGLFHQSFKDGVQNELPDPWLTAHSWAEKTDTVPIPVELAGKDLQCPSVQAGRHGLRGPHEHAESVRSRHH